MYFTITFFSAVDNLRIVESACRKSLFSPLNKFSDLHKSSENLFVLKAIGRLSKRVSLWLKPLQIFDVDIAAIEMEQAEDDAPSPVHRPPLCIALNDTFYVVLVRGRPCAVRISGLTAR